MKQGLTELVFILDRSGSMMGLEQDTIGGYNSLLEKQRNTPGEAVITTVLFDDRYELIHDNTPLVYTGELTKKEYFVRGSTALLDAIGRTIQSVIQRRRTTKPEDRPEKTIFVITTDGAENSSWEYSPERIKSMIEYQTEMYHWEFLFLGANIDAVSIAGQFGIAADRAVQYHADSRGTQLNYAVLSEAISDFRASKQGLRSDWKQQIDEDYKKRQKTR